MCVWTTRPWSGGAGDARPGDTGERKDFLHPAGDGPGPGEDIQMEIVKYIGAARALPGTGGGWVVLAEIGCGGRGFPGDVLGTFRVDGERVELSWVQVRGRRGGVRVGKPVDGGVARGVLGYLSSVLGTRGRTAGGHGELKGGV